jgi:hypothetical protein
MTVEAPYTDHWDPAVTDGLAENREVKRSI